MRFVLCNLNSVGECVAAFRLCLRHSTPTTTAPLFFCRYSVALSPPPLTVGFLLIYATPMASPRRSSVSIYCFHSIPTASPMSLRASQRVCLLTDSSLCSSFSSQYEYLKDFAIRTNVPEEEAALRAKLSTRRLDGASEHFCVDHSDLGDAGWWVSRVVQWFGCTSCPLPTGLNCLCRVESATSFLFVGVLHGRSERRLEAKIFHFLWSCVLLCWEGWGTEKVRPLLFAAQCHS